MPEMLPPLIPLADFQLLFLYEANWRYRLLNSQRMMVNIKCCVLKRVLSETIELLVNNLLCISLIYIV